jgi:hypothetical protein
VKDIGETAVSPPPFVAEGAGSSTPQAAKNNKRKNANNVEALFIIYVSPKKFHNSKNMGCAAFYHVAVFRNMAEQRFYLFSHIYKNKPPKQLLWGQNSCKLRFINRLINRRSLNGFETPGI